MKKHKILLALLVVLTVAVSMLAACVIEKEHEHTWEAKYDGTNHWEECECGEIQNTTAHVFTDEVTQPTCTDGGYTTHTCECGYSTRDGETAPLGHDYQPKKDDKNHWLECSVCNDKKDVAEHTYTSEVTPPTCTDGGYTTYTCECGYSYRDGETAPLGHKNVENINAVVASYATTGTKEYYTCGVCNKHFEDEDCTKEIANLEDWVAGDGLISAQKDNDAFGTQENPYTIANLTDYVAFADACNGGNKFEGKYFKLMANIGSEEEPVTTITGNAAAKYFAGNFDGNKKEIFVELSSDVGGVAVFGYVSGASISDLMVKGQITYNGTSSAAGSIVGAAVYGSGGETTVTGCKNYATITATGNSQYAIVGGIVGSATGNLKIKNCLNCGTLSSEKGCAGGILGRLQYLKDKPHTATIEDCLNDETAVFAAIAVGDQVGLVQNETTLNVSYAHAKITDGDVDRIVGKVENGATINITHTTHTFTHVDAVEANCTETGLKEHYVCNNCGKLFERDGENHVEKTIEELTIAVNDNHAYDEWVHDEGKETHSRVCRRNAEHKETVACEVTLVKGDTVAPDFDKEGYTEYTCSVCRATYKKDVQSALVAVARVGETKYRTLDEAIKAAGNDGVVTLLADGETKLVDGQTLKVVKGGFTLSVTTDVEGKLVNETTDSESGVTTYALAEKHVHNYSETKYDEKDHWQECSCGEKQNISAHVFVDVVTQATCTEGGYTTHTCECGYSYRDRETVPEAHTLSHTEAVAASYATTGAKEYYTCGVCNKHFEDESCTKKIANLEDWLAGDGLISAQKGNDTFGTEGNPYTIANKVDYDAFAGDCNGGNKFAGKYVKLMADIGSEADPVKARIGNASANYFAGNFDGNNKNVWLGQSLSGHVGMFGVADHGAVIKNVTVNGSIVNTTATKDMGLGGIVGSVIAKGDASVALTLINCTSNVTLSHTGSAVIGIGGLVGRFQTTGSVESCTNNGSVTASSASYAGGVVGYASATVTITDCKNTGNVTLSTDGQVGGILGMTSVSTANVSIKGCTVENCTLQSNFSVGGIVGRIYQGKVTFVNWNDDCIKNVTFVKGETTVENPIAGIDNTGRTEAKGTNPGIMFGTCAANGKAEQITE